MLFPIAGYFRATKFLPRNNILTANVRLFHSLHLQLPAYHTLIWK